MALDTEGDMSEQDLLKCINDFSERVRSSREGYIDDEGQINGESTNRGNKLKAGSSLVHRDRINGYNNDNEPSELVHYGRSKRSVLKKKRRRLDTYNYNYNPDKESGARPAPVFEETVEVEDDPYTQIDIEEILAPITHPSDIVTRSSLSRTYKSDVLKKLAQQAIETIQKEQNTVVQLSKLLDILLGEDSNQLLEAQLLLPEYNHNLVNSEQQSQVKDSQQQAAGTDLDKRVTRRQSTQEVDPFFALPNIKVDPDFGLDPEDAEEARQLSQISLQRSEELIRNLTSLRNGIVRAQTLKEKLLQWGKEINGDPDESDIYQAEKEAAAAANPQATKENDKEKSSGSATPQVGATATPEVRTSGRPRRSAM